MAGELLREQSEAKLARLRARHVGVLLQNPARNLLTYATAGDNLLFAQRTTRSRGRDKAKRAAEMLESVGLSGVASARSGALSGGAARRATWVGNPLRDDIVALPPPAQRFVDRSGALRVLVLGGSLGAAAINGALPAALATIASAQRPQVVHQAGTRHGGVVRAAQYAPRPRMTAPIVRQRICTSSAGLVR